METIKRKPKNKKPITVKRDKGKDYVAFICVQCDAKQVSDFTNYPLCKKCKEINIRVLNKKKEKNEENS